RLPARSLLSSTRAIGRHRRTVPIASRRGPRRRAPGPRASTPHGSDPARDDGPGAGAPAERISAANGTDLTLARAASDDERPRTSSATAMASIAARHHLW